MHNESGLDTSYELVELKLEKKHPEYKLLINEYKNHSYTNRVGKTSPLR